MPHRIRDVTVAEAIAAEAGTDDTPELELSNIVSPVINLQQRPPLAVSGYFPGIIGVTSAASALNFSHIGIFGSGAGRGMVQVDAFFITNVTGAFRDYTVRRLDAPFTGWPSVRAVPGYSNAGNTQTGGVFSITKNDTALVQATLMAEVGVPDGITQIFPCNILLNDGALVIARGAINSPTRGGFFYRHWPAIRVQTPG